MLQSTMMDTQLSLVSILERANRFYARREVVSVLPVGFNPETKQPIPGVHRTTYGQIYPRVMQLANALKAAGVGEGDRVATMALNHYRHLEAYFAIPCMGAVLHTVNIRLHPSQICFILNDAQDKVLLIDNLFVAMLPTILERVPSIEKVIVMGPVPTGLPEGTLDYEAFIKDQPTAFSFPEINEQQACGLCYTSGTTGNPKGVLYSHRAVVLHSLASCMPDAMGIGERDSVMPIVPMFHVNAWGLPYTCAMAGAKQVYMSAFSVSAPLVAKTMQDEKVTEAAGVPTVWMALLEELDRAKAAGTPYDLSSLKGLIVGGSAAPRPMIKAYMERHGIRILHAWGMTETTPLGSLNSLSPEYDSLDPEAIYDKMALSGRASALIDLEVVDDEGKPLPHDGKTMGRLIIRGPWVTQSYFHTGNVTENGWFDTGDIATIDPDGYMLIQDRAKDLIKSGGEWISSVDLENHLMGHPSVKAAAVIALPHPKWDERPLGVIVLREGMEASKEDLNQFLSSKVAKWWLPDDYVYVAELPLTATGKFLKRALREQFKDHTLPTV